MALRQVGLARIFCELFWFLGGSFPLRNNQSRGWYGEWLARRYLKRKNLSVLKKNWRSPQDARREIDHLYGRRMLGLCGSEGTIPKFFEQRILFN